MSERYDKSAEQQVQPKSGAATDQGTTPVNSPDTEGAPKHTVRGPEEHAKPSETAALPTAAERVVVVSGPAPTNESGVAELDKRRLVDTLRDIGWEVLMADQQPQASLPVDAPIVYFGSKPEFELSDLEPRKAVIFVRDRHWTSFEKKYRELKMGELLPEQLHETVKFVSYPHKAVDELLKTDAERGNVAEGSRQAAQNRNDRQPGRLAGRPEGPMSPPERERKPGISLEPGE